jgi:hypothetical protein
VAVDEVPVVQLDYTFMVDAKILDIYSVALHGGAATGVERKGDWEFAVRWIALKLTEFGLRDVRLRSDLEPSARFVGGGARGPSWRRLPRQVIKRLVESSDSTGRSRTKFGR